MNINHNRIKVADLEINEPNKTLITNDNGELEFSDITGGSQTLQQTLTEGNSASLPIVLSSGDSTAKLHVNSPLGTTSLGASNIDLIKSGGGQVTINANGTIQWVGATNALFTLPSKPNGYTGELATLDDISNTDDFVSKTGEVSESIDGNKTFIDTITFRQSEETRMNIDGNVLKFITNDNSSSSTISPVELSGHRTQLLPDKDGTFAMLEDISGGSYALQDIINNGSNITEGNTITNTVNGGSSSFSPFDFSVFNNSEGFAILRHKTLSFGDNSGNVGVLHGDSSNGQYYLPNKTNGSYILATLDDLTVINDNFIHKTGEVTESIDGYKLFRSTIQIRGVDDEVSTSVSSSGITYSENGYPSLTLSTNHLGGGEGTNSLVEIPRKSGTLVLSVNGEVADESGNVVIGGSNVDASATTAGSINNTSLQELGGVDKLINGVRVGKGAGIGVENTALGFETLQNNTGGYNTGVGYNALKANTSGAGNLGTGSSSLVNNTTGSRNTGVGSYSLYTNTTGEYNTGVGNNALYSNTTGSSNLAAGTYAMVYNTTGHHNVSVGEQSLYTNQFGNYNTAIGAGALYYNAGTAGSNIFGHQCTAIGAGSMAFNTTGHGTAVGAFSLYKQTTGTHNIVFGFQSGGGITTGNNNTIIAGTGFITVGGGITTGSNNLIVAQNNGNTTGITTGSGNTVIGKVTGLAAAATNTVTIADGVGNIALTKSTTGEIAAPNLTNALINSGGNKSLLTLEYLNSKIGTTAPTSATATGTVGEIRVTPGYIYWCTAPNTWIRAAGTTF